MTIPNDARPTGGDQSHLARIRRNVSRMIDMDAPEADIDQYLSEEGVTAQDLRSYGQSLKTTAPQAPTPQRPAPDDAGAEAYSGPPAPTPEDEWSPVATDQSDPYNDDWLARQEESFQASQGQPAPYDASPAPNASAAPGRPPQSSALQAGLIGAADSATFGTIDEIGAGLQSVIPGLNDDNIWNGSSLSDAYDANVARNRKVLDMTRQEHPIASIAGSVAGGVLPIGGAFRAAKASGALKKLGASAATGAAYGSAYGLGSGEGGFTDRLDSAAMGGLAGAAGGAVLHGAASVAAKAVNPLIEKLAPGVAQARFASQQADNQWAGFDASVAQDMDKLVRSLIAGGAKRKLDKSADAALVSRVDDLERSYLPYDEIKGLDLPPSVRAKLKTAMDRRMILSDDDVIALRDGTPAGEAVAEGIMKARRLRAFVPEAASGRGSSAGRIMAEAAGSAVGWKAAGPLGGAAGSIAGRLVSGGGGSSATRQSALAAKALAAQAPKYAKMPEVAEALGRPRAADALAKLSNETMDAPYLAQREAERLAAEGQRVLTKNAQDNITPQGGWRGYVYERTGLLPADQDAGALKAMADGKITPDQFEAFLKAPDKLQPGNAGNGLVERLSAMADNGTLKRDPKWKPPVPDAVIPVIRKGDGNWSSLSDVPQAVRDEAMDQFFAANPQASGHLTVRDGNLIVQEDAASKVIRNPLAYQATARGNQARVTSALQSVRDNDGMDFTTREVLSDAIANVGNVSSRTEAGRIVASALDKLPDDASRAQARSILSPLVSQIKRD